MGGRRHYDGTGLGRHPAGERLIKNPCPSLPLNVRMMKDHHPTPAKDGRSQIRHGVRPMDVYHITLPACGEQITRSNGLGPQDTVCGNPDHRHAATHRPRGLSGGLPFPPGPLGAHHADFVACGRGPFGEGGDDVLQTSGIRWVELAEVKDPQETFSGGRGFSMRPAAFSSAG